jgi:hypothetical protein
MNRCIILGVLLAGLACSGCQAAYTSIRQIDQTRYHVTRTKVGFLNTYGTLYECVARGTEMTCREISEL